MSASSESEYDLDDPFTCSLYPQSPSKKVREGTDITAAELVASREKFWNAHENLLKNFSSVQADERPRGDEDLANNVYLPKADSEENVIQLTHPGRDILCRADSLLDIQPVALVYDMCTTRCHLRSRFLQELTRWGEQTFLFIIYNRISSKFDSCTEEDLNVVATNILALMAISKEAALSESCRDLLLQFRPRWTPSIGAILNIFIFWGIPVKMLIPTIYGNPEDFQLFANAPQYVPQIHNISQVMQYLTSLFEQDYIFRDFGRVSLLFRAVLLTHLDISQRTSPQLHLSQSCLSSLLSQLSEEDWNDNEKLAQHCRNVYFLEEHFHNQAFICTSLLDFCPRCRHISIYLAWQLLRQMTSNHRLDCPTEDPNSKSNEADRNPTTEGQEVNMDNEEPGSLLCLVELLVQRKANIIQLDLYQLHILLTLINYLVANCNISSSDSEELRQIIDFVSELNLLLPHRILSVDCNMIKSMLTRVTLHWKKMHSKLTPYINDSQDSQPSPVKLR